MKKTINLICPTSWQELSDKQLRFVFSLIADEATSVELRTLCLFKWNKLKVLSSPNLSQKTKPFMLKRGRERFPVRSWQITSALDHLRWLDDVPLFPVRIASVGKHSALPADFQEVPLSTFLYLDNLYQGYLSTKDETLLSEMLTIMYDSTKIHATRAELIGVFYWFASLKQYFANMFPNFLQSASSPLNAGLGSLSGDIGKRLQDSMNAQIRALTKGDITKEKKVLAMDTWRAMFELDAQAKEARELKAKYK